MDSSSIYVEGKYAYLVGSRPLESNSSLIIIDISDIENPTLMADYAVIGKGSSISVSNGYAYLFNDVNGLMVFNVSNPSSPSFVRTNDFSNLKELFSYDSSQIEIVNNNLYITSTYGFYLLDISNPKSVQEVGYYDNGGYGKNISVLDNHVYFISGFGLLSSQDLLVLDKNSFDLVGSYGVKSNIRRMQFSGNYAYTEGKYGLSILDISSPSSPFLAGTYRKGFSGWVIFENYMYMRQVAPTFPRDNFLTIFDISNSHHPKKIGQIKIDKLADRAVRMNVNNGYLYIHSDKYGSGGNLVFDITLPNAPVKIDPIPLNYYDNEWSSLTGNLLYSLSENGPRYDLVIQDYTSGSLLGSYDMVSYGFDPSLVLGNPIIATNPAHEQLYIFKDGELVILNVSDSSSPVKIGSSNLLDSSTKSITLNDNYAFVTDQYGVVMLDIRNPATPTILDSYDTEGDAGFITVNGSYLYLSDGEKGLKIFSY